jgi:hypothetical protein
LSFTGTVPYLPFKQVKQYSFQQLERRSPLSILCPECIGSDKTIKRNLSGDCFLKEVMPVGFVLANTHAARSFVFFLKKASSFLNLKIF